MVNNLNISNNYFKEDNSSFMKDLLIRSLNYILSFIISMTIILGIILASISFKPIYSAQINSLDVVQSNLSKDEMIKNYNYTIDYILNNPKKGLYEDFNLPDLPSSKEGKIHFKEVSFIIYVMKNLFFIGILLSTVSLIYFFKRKTFIFFKYSAVILFSLPIIVLVPMAINFNKTFNVFHGILFNNDYWLFNPKTDPIINILPEELFLNFSLLIVSSIFLFSFLFFYLYKKNKNSNFKIEKS